MHTIKINEISPAPSCVESVVLGFCVRGFECCPRVPEFLTCRKLHANGGLIHTMTSVGLTARGMFFEHWFGGFSSRLVWWLNPVVYCNKCQLGSFGTHSYKESCRKNCSVGCQKGAGGGQEGFNRGNQMCNNAHSMLIHLFALDLKNILHQLELRVYTNTWFCPSLQLPFDYQCWLLSDWYANYSTSAFSGYVYCSVYCLISGYSAVACRACCEQFTISIPALLVCRSVYRLY